MVLADAEDVESNLVGELDLLDEVAQPLLGRRSATGAGIRLASTKL